MKKSVILLVLIIFISSISLAQELMPGRLFINNVEIPYSLEKVKKEPRAISYVYANGQRIAKVENNEVFYYHNDHLGSPVAITDSKGEVVWQGDYMPFGEAFNEISFDGNKVKYNSKELDKDTELNYYGARYYDSSSGRFITADTVEGSLVDPQSLNLYVYTRNNPMRYVDLSGEQIDMPLITSSAEPDKTLYSFDRWDLVLLSSFYNRKVVENAKNVKFVIENLIDRGGDWDVLLNRVRINKLLSEEKQERGIIHEYAHMIYGDAYSRNLFHKLIYGDRNLALMNQEDRDNFIKDMRKFLDSPNPKSDIYGLTSYDTTKEFINHRLSLPNYAELKTDKQKGTEWFAFTAEYIYWLKSVGISEDKFSNNIPNYILRYYEEFLTSEPSIQESGFLKDWKNN